MSSSRDLFNTDDTGLSRLARGLRGLLGIHFWSRVISPSVIAMIGSLFFVFLQLLLEFVKCCVHRIHQAFRRIGGHKSASLFRGDLDFYSGTFLVLQIDGHSR